MDNDVALDTYLLKPYFKNLEYSDEKYSIEIVLLTDPGYYGFTVRMEIREPAFQGAYPQRKFSLEQHAGPGHKGPHLQINYHLVSNYMKIGKLYIHLDVDSDKEMLEISRGFVYTLYEILSTFGEEMQSLIEYIFEVEMLEEISDKKALLIEKVQESFSSHMVEIIDVEKGKQELFQPGEFEKLLRDRTELVPLLGEVKYTT